MSWTENSAGNRRLPPMPLVAANLNQPPTVATPAAATPNPVTGTSTALSVLGADDGGEANLTYTWIATGTPPAPVSFSVNGTNGAKNTTATFTQRRELQFPGHDHRRRRTLHHQQRERYRRQDLVEHCDPARTGGDGRQHDLSLQRSRPGPVRKSFGQPTCLYLVR